VAENKVDIAAVNLPDPKLQEYDHRDLADEESEDTVTPAAEPPAAAAPEAPPEKPAEPTPKPLKSAHPRALVRRALELGAARGITRDQIEAATPEELDDWLEQEEALQKQMPVEDKKPAKEEDDDEIVLDDEVVGTLDKGIQKALKAVPKLLKQNKELSKKLEDAEKRDHIRNQKLITEAIDASFAAVPDRYKKLVGEGGIDDIDKTGKEAQRRLAILRHANIDPTKDSARTIAKKVKDTLDLLYGDETPEPAPAPVKQEKPVEKNGKRITPDQWAAAATPAPTRRQIKEPKGQAAAISAVNTKLREMGILGADIDDAPELDTVPD